MIETERLRLYPASQPQMESFIAAETDFELRTAYTQMLKGSLEHPEQWAWYAMWMIERKDGSHVGDLCFKGLSADGRAEIGYGLLEEFQGQGYATEAVKAAVDWAFEHPEVTALEAEALPDNIASQRVLAKCGFVPTGEMGEEGARYRALR